MEPTPDREPRTEYATRPPYGPSRPGWDTLTCGRRATAEFDQICRDVDYGLSMGEAIEAAQRRIRSEAEATIASLTALVETLSGVER